MATSVIPALIDAMLSTFAAALPSVRVYDGTGVSDHPGGYLMIGVDDPDSDAFALSADAEQDWADANYTARSETGSITCAALSWNGDGNQKTARDGAYAITAAVETALRSNPSLGLANVLWTSFGTRVELSQVQSHQGAAALLVFSISFRAHLI
jgi:hypothetical protein